MADIYPFEPKRMVWPPEYDAHVSAYDANVFMAYRIAAKKRKDDGMAMALKQSVNIFMFPFRSIRQRLHQYYPDYLKEQGDG